MNPYGLSYSVVKKVAALRDEISSEFGCALVGEPIWSVVMRFSTQIELPDGDGCWVWKGQTNSNGYGIFQLNKQSQLAHRVSFSLANGPIEDWLFVLHSCDNPICVNPKHLSAGTHADNMEHKVLRGRCNSRPKTNRLVDTKLDPTKVKEIIERYNSGETQNALALSYSVSAGTISRVLSGTIWAHIDAPRPRLVETGEGDRSTHRRIKSTLTPDSVYGIKSLLANGVTGVEVAKRYGVSQSLISQIHRGKQWAHITLERPQ